MMGDLSGHEPKISLEIKKTDPLWTCSLQGKKFEYFRDLILGKKSISTIDIVDRSVLEEERILSAKNTDAEQTNLTQSRRDLVGR
jgi:hypothetical protein